MRSEVSLHLKNTSKVYLFVVILKGDLNKIMLLQFIYICNTTEGLFTALVSSFLAVFPCAFSRENDEEI